jgi:long-chain acyl-CoA synthetase
MGTVAAVPCQALLPSAARCTHLRACSPRPWLQREVARALAGRPPHEHVRAFAVLEVPFAIEDGTLTRTMKPRKQAIFAKYAEQVAQVECQLR